MKLSESQQQVIDRMKDGWTLCQSMTIHGRFWMRNKDVSKFLDINTNTIHALTKRRLIERDQQSYPTSTWKLTERAK